MSAAAKARPAPITKRMIFEARAEAHALLWQAAEFDLHEAVDKLQADAERDGLIDEIGQDAVREILAQAFEIVR